MLHKTKKQSTFIVPALIAMVNAPVALGFDISTSDPDLSVRWDNTLKYSTIYRLSDPDDEYLSSTIGSGAGDGNRNFEKGLASNRLDILSEFDVSYKNTGFRISGDAWYDDVYNGKNDNDSGISHNVSVPSDEFSDGVKETLGRDARLLDAFGYWKGKIGSMPTRINIGRHTVIYGETLMGGNNGVAAAQGPVDIVKAATVPGAKVKEFLLPVNQFSTSLRPSRNMTLGAYYQFEWQESNFFAPGSFLSPNDVYGEDAEAMFSSPFGGVFERGDDIEAKDSGQWGAQMRYRPNSVDVELGLYVANWHDKTMTAAYLDPVVDQNYRRVFHEDIQLVGLSASGVLGNTSVSLEMSRRENMPLVGGNAFVQATIPASVSSFDNQDNPAYPVGETLHATVVAIDVIQPNAIFKQGGSAVLQYDYHTVLGVDKNEDLIDDRTTKGAHQLTFALQADYFNVLDGLDLSVPVVLGYTTGRSRVYTGWVENGGTLDIGVKGTYLSTWSLSLNYRDYFGSNEGSSIGSAPVGDGDFDQTLFDRDFVSFTVSRTL